MSPGLPAVVGVAIPTVYFLDTVAEPCRNRESISTPLLESEVTFSLKITGPLNSEVALLSDPPSTITERENLPSRGLTTLILELLPMSSPVTV